MKNIFLMCVLFFMVQTAICQVSKNENKLKTSASSTSALSKTTKRILNFPVVYTFIGNGNWDVASNWQDGVVPPPDISPGSEIHINSMVPGAKCILNVPYEIPNTTNTIKLIVYTGNQLVVPDLIVK